MKNLPKEFIILLFSNKEERYVYLHSFHLLSSIIGIYRHVKLVKAGPVHFDLFGVFAPATIVGPVVTRSTPEQGVTGSYATVHVNVDISNIQNVSSMICVNFTLQDASGAAAASASLTEEILGLGQLNLKQNLDVTNPELWSIPRPYLYNLIVSISSCGSAPSVGDTVVTAVGLRKLYYDPNLGLYLNEQNVKVRG